MFRDRFSLRSVAKGLACLAAVVMFTACGGDGKKTDNDNNGNETEEPASDTVANAFQQFGIDVEKIKPNVAAPNDVAIQYGNKVDATVYYRKALYEEKSDTDISAETGLDYNTRMFNYIKSISADGKCYTSYTSSDNPEEITSYDKGTALIWNYTWSYKYNGMWVDVYMEYTMSGDKNIGIGLQGAGSY